MRKLTFMMLCRMQCRHQGGVKWGAVGVTVVGQGECDAGDGWMAEFRPHKDAVVAPVGEIQ